MEGQTTKKRSYLRVLDCLQFAKLVVDTLRDKSERVSMDLPQVFGDNETLLRKLAVGGLRTECRACPFAFIERSGAA